jgi:hypothetical protein
MMDKNDVGIGDTVEIISGWFRGARQGVVIRKDEKKALVYGGGSLGSYRYEKLTLITPAAGNEVLDATREFVEKVKAFL